MRVDSSFGVVVEETTVEKSRDETCEWQEAFIEFAIALRQGSGFV
jgi:hypothetical protein